MLLGQLRWRMLQHDRAFEIHNNTLRRPHLHKDRSMVVWMNAADAEEEEAAAAGAEALEMKSRYSLARFCNLVQSDHFPHPRLPGQNLRSRHYYFDHQEGRPSSHKNFMQLVVGLPVHPTIRTRAFRVEIPSPHVHQRQTL
jgi:hypothetical protein